MEDRTAKLHRLTEELQSCDAVVDAFVAKSFTDRHVIVDLHDETVPSTIRTRLAQHDLKSASDVYGHGGDTGPFTGGVGDATRHHFVDVRTRGSHRSYVVE